MEVINEGKDVVCILYLEVRYCITGVNVYMDMNFVDKNLTDLSYLTAFFCIVNLSHCKREKKVSDYFGRNNVHFPNIILHVCVCVHEGVCASVCVCVSNLTVIFGFSGATRFVFCKKIIPEY